MHQDASVREYAESSTKDCSCKIFELQCASVCYTNSFLEIKKFKLLFIFTTHNKVVIDF